MSSNKSTVPAHAVWVELSTRIATQPLHSRSGDEETAVASIVAIFKKTRELMEKNPEAEEFLSVAAALLETVRPFTARWHGWMTEDKELRDKEGRPLPRFRDEWVRHQFRRELAQLQPLMIGFAKAFNALRKGEIPERKWIAPKPEELEELAKEAPKPKRAKLGKDLLAGIGPQLAIHTNPPGQDATRIAAINDAERAEILKRRVILNLPHADDSKRELINATGLGFSGGGIRSATFCLGVAQVLARRGLLKQFDFMSTVSGGGYFGSFLSSYLGTGDFHTETPPQNQKEKADDATKRFESAFHSNADRREPAAIRHLRNYSRYLQDGTPLRKAAGIGIVLLGILFNLLILMQIPLGAALLTKALHASRLLGNFDWIRDENHWFPPGTALWSKALVMLGFFTAVWSLIYPRVKSRAMASPKLQGARDLKLWEKIFPIILGISIFFLTIWVLPAIFRGYHSFRTAEIWGHLGALKQRLEGLSAVTGLSLTVLIGGAAARLKGEGTTGRLLKFAAVIAGPLLCVFIYLSVSYRMIFPVGAEPWHWGWVFAIFGLLAWWAWGLVDVNTYSPHGYYRDRLCSCYLLIRRWVADPQSIRPSLNLVEFEKTRLVELNGGAAAPYHLINTTVNLPTSESRELRGRNGDFFLFSKHWCGSPLIGYFPTSEIEAVDRHINLGTAMAISGAAASSNMGWQTKDSLRMLMTLANVRLGYWLRNPRLGVAVAEKMWGPGSLWLFREMFARGMDETKKFLNLSDGGHIENLACYELMRRRAKFIVCIDGGMEPSMVCEDLMRLERYASIDLGIRMHYDVADLRLQANGFSKAYGTLVKIDYNPPRTEFERRNRKPEDAEWGWMIYLKLAMIGYAPGYVMDYKRQNPGFPHESTGDQIYDEAQFEAYRALGETAAESLFNAAALQANSMPTIAEWFSALADTILPDNDEAFR